jgi:hypothetical protein
MQEQVSKIPAPAFCSCFLIQEQEQHAGAG